jgi:parallel beta-helix repeat protein
MLSDFMKGIYPTLSHSILLLLGLTAMSLVVVSVYSSLSTIEKNLVSVELNFIADSARNKILETYSFVNQSSDYERGLFYLGLPEEIGNKKYTITLKQNELMVNITVKDEQLSASRQLPIDAELMGSSFMPACVRVEKRNIAQSTYKIVEIVSCGVPQWFNSYINSTLAGTSILHALKWSSNDGLSGYIFSFDNCTGTFVNDTWTNNNGLFIGTEAWSNVTKKISSNIGCTVRWKIYTNNSNNVWGASPEFSYITTSGQPPQTFCDFNITSIPYTISQNNSYYCLVQNSRIDGLTAIYFASVVQNSTLDCLGHNINSNDTSDTYGVYLAGSLTMNNTIKNCNTTDFFVGIYLNSSNHNTIVNNTANNNSPYGIKLWTSSNNTIVNNTLTNNSYGIFLYSSSNNNIIINNTANNNSASGILLNSTSNYNTIINNTANGNSNGIYFEYSSNDITINNTANKNNNIGIWLYSTSNNNIFTNNTLTNNSYSGIFLYSNSNNTFTSNTLNNNNDGILLNSSFNNIFTNNTLNSNSNIGVYLESSSNNSMRGGSISNNTLDYVLVKTGSTNNFTNTNFTAARSIYFDSATNWFNYNNDTGSIWLKTNVSAQATITRKLINWNNTLMQWNESADKAITAIYNITGLLTNTSYNVYNNSILTYTISSGFNGEISFTINLTVGQEKGIRVEKSVPGPNLVLWFKLNENSGTTAYDSSIYKNNGTILNYTTQCSNPPTSGCSKWVTGIYGSAINFSEHFNKINVSDRPELHLTNNFTIEFWVKPFDLNPVNNYMLCKCTSICGDGNNDWAIIWGWNSTYPNGIEFYAQGYSGSDPRNNSLIIIPDNTNWHHMAYTYNGSQWSGYRDGSSVFSVARFFSLRVQTITWFSVDAPFMPESWPFYRGMLDDIRIYNRSLSQAEINVDMNSD